MGKYNILNNNNEGSNYHQILHQHLINHHPLNSHAILAMAAQSSNNLNLTATQIQCLQHQKQSNKTSFFPQKLGNQSQQMMHSQFNGMTFKNPIPHPTTSHSNNNTNKVSNSKLSPIGSIASCATSPSSQTSTISANFSSLSPSPASPTTDSQNFVSNTSNNPNPGDIPNDLPKREKDCDQEQGLESNSSEITTLNGTSDQSNEPLNSSATEINEDHNNEFNKVYLVYFVFYLDEECYLIQNIVMNSLVNKIFNLK